MTMGQVPMSFEDIGQPSFFSRWLLTWFGTFTRTCTTPRVMVVGTCHLQGRQPLPWGRSPVSFRQIGLGVVFQGKSWDKGPSSLAYPAQDGASSMAGGSWRDLAHLLTPVLLLEGWWQGLAIFRGSSPYHGAGPLWVLSRLAKLHFSAGGSWHDLAHLLVLYCSSRDGGRDLPFSGEAAPTMGKVSCEFRADRPGLHFSAGGSGHDLAHLLWAALLQGGFRYGPAVFKGWCPHDGAGPLWVSRRLAKLYFSASSSWRDLAHLLWAALLQGGFRYGPTVFRGWCPYDGGRYPVSFEEISQPSFFSQWLLMWFGTFTVGRVEGIWPAIFRGCCTHQGTCRGPSPDQGAPPWRWQVDGTIPH